MTTLVIVKWNDAKQYSSSIGYTIEDCLGMGLLEIETVGFLLEETEEVVRVASERRDVFTEKHPPSNNRYGEVIVIPASQVVSIRKVRIREPK